MLNPLHPEDQQAEAAMEEEMGGPNDRYEDRASRRETRQASESGERLQEGSVMDEVAAATQRILAGDVRKLVELLEQQAVTIARSGEQVRVHCDSSADADSVMEGLLALADVRELERQAPSDEVAAAAERLKEFIRDRMTAPEIHGHMTAATECQCPLCDVDRLQSRERQANYGGQIMFNEPHALGSAVVTVSREKAIAHQKRAAAAKGHQYQSDEEALEDFMVVNWAWCSPAADVPEDAPVTEEWLRERGGVVDENCCIVFSGKMADIMVDVDGCVYLFDVSDSLLVFNGPGKISQGAFMKWLLAIGEGCQHEWTDARNEVVASGEICLTCGAMRATPEGAE